MRLSEAAKVTVRVERVLRGRRVRSRCVKPSRKVRTRKKCVRYSAVGTLRFVGVAGQNSVRFNGRMGRKALAPGNYRMTVRATDPSRNVSVPRSAKARVVRAKRK